MNEELEERRSTKAGGLTPATRAGYWRKRELRFSLNKGRGINPGDTADRDASKLER